jgi:hypothetical protein
MALSAARSMRRAWLGEAAPAAARASRARHAHCVLRGGARRRGACARGAAAVCVPTPLVGASWLTGCASHARARASAPRSEGRRRRAGLRQVRGGAPCRRTACCARLGAVLLLRRADWPLPRSSPRAGGRRADAQLLRGGAHGRRLRRREAGRLARRCAGKPSLLRAAAARSCARALVPSGPHDVRLPHRGLAGTTRRRPTDTGQAPARAPAFVQQRAC